MKRYVNITDGKGFIERGIGVVHESLVDTRIIRINGMAALEMFIECCDYTYESFETQEECDMFLMMYPDADLEVYPDEP